LDISAIGPVCAKDVPYIEVTFGAQSQFNGRPASVTFRDLNGNVVGTDSATYQAGTTVRFVYPGASVDAAGNATDWPGWVFDGDEWVVDPSDANLRAGLTVVIEVNPTATATVSYPPATTACANPVQVDPAPTTTTATVPAGALPQTGSSTTVLASIAALLVLAGGGALMATRRSTAKG
jgi:LPXTG-motif cell wall-anchored protein